VVESDVPVALVWAQSRDGVIGRDGTLPWHLPEDLAHFRALTWGGVVLMGRRTWCSLPDAVRPLPGRRCLVLSRRPGFSAAGAHVHASLASALADAAGDGAPVWVAGGAQVYAAALPLAARVVVTEVDLVVSGTDVADAGRLARAPRLDDAWRETARTPSEGWATSTTGLRYRVRDLRRDQPPGRG
jgi:dihydrofolate reductase